MKIKKQVNHAQNFLIKKRLITLFQWLVLFSSFIFFLTIMLETIFYFSKNTKTLSLIIFSLLLVSFLIFMIFEAIRGKKNEIKRYKLETIAKDLGHLSFPKKPDTVLNALQLESGLNKNESNDLAKAFTNTILSKIKDSNLLISNQNKKSNHFKKPILILWIAMILFFSFNYSQSAESFFRWRHPLTNFLTPKPFTLSSVTKNIHILGGEKVKIKILSSLLIPDTVKLNLIPIQISTKKRDSLKLSFNGVLNEEGIYSFLLPELYQDYTYQAEVKAKYFWQSWEQVTSELDTIFVTDRPSLEKFRITLIPPKYSKLPAIIQEGNNAVIKGLKGSNIEMEIKANRVLKKAYLLLEENESILKSNHKNASGNHIIKDEDSFSINLVDERGITNKDPILYNIELIPDFIPTLTVLQPSSYVELGDDQSIPFLLNIQDDYGFTNLQITYEIIKPSILKLDPYVSMITIPEVSKDSIAQNISYLWDLGDLFLMPDDEIHFHIELTDNDAISGPKKTISSTFIAKVPSLESLYQKAEISEKDFIESLSKEVEEMEKLKDQFEALEMKALKTDELDWEQKKSVENSIEKAKNEIKKLEKISKSLDDMKEQADKHKLFSSELLNKFEELSNLINNIVPKDMLKNISELEEALDNMDMDSIEESISELTKNMDQIEKELERYLEIFKQIQMEQKFDELRNRMEKLTKQQESLDEKLIQNQNTNSSNQRLAIEEKRILNEFENIQSLIEETADLIKPSNQKVSEDLLELSESDLVKNINKALEETEDNISNNKLNAAQSSSQQSIENMKKMIEKITSAQENFQNQSLNEMTEKFEEIIQDVLYLSAKEEYLNNGLKNITSRSPRIKFFASQQQLVQDQLRSVTNKMINLSKETFAITPAIGRGIGKASSSMNLAKIKLADRNILEAKNNQIIAIEGLNQIVIELYNNMKDMQKSGSSSGYEQLLKMMEEMAGKQKGLNNKSEQLTLGQMAAAAKQQMLQEMLSGQKSVKKSLEQLMKEMNASGGNKLGNLDGIAQEIDKVIHDLEKNNFKKETHKRQQKILSRMLESKTSMTQRGEKEERKSFSANGKNIFDGPIRLPTEKGQREDLTLKALNNAINAGYSKQYQGMIKRYFNSLTKTDLDNEN